MDFYEEMERIARDHGEAAYIAFAEREATAGNTEALYTVANWRLWGINGPQLLEQGYSLLAAATLRGHADAAVAQAGLLATGTGTARDVAAARAIVQAYAAQYAALIPQVRIFDAMQGDVPAAEPLCEAPGVAMVRGLIPEEACAYLIARSRDRLQPSMIVDPQSGERRPNPIRTSLGTNYAPVEEDLVLHAINQRMAAASATQVEQGEPLHVLCYEPGQEYKLHLDALPGVRNQRLATVLLYLNDDYQGGETVFPALDIKVRGKAGDALVFDNLTTDGAADPRAEHAGLPVTSGVKWLATRWIRQQPYHPWKPETGL